ncbi:MAG: dipeptidase [Acidobacteria bacterium]|nr:dipeptidase [Acidobacteriota bacterium]
MANDRATRRELIKGGLAAAGLAAAGSAEGATPETPYIRRGRHVVFPQTGREYSSRTVDLMERAIVVDMLSPLQLQATAEQNWIADPARFGPDQLAAYRSSGITSFHVAVGVGGGREPELAVSNYLAAYNGFVAAHSDDFMRIDSADDFSRAKANDKIGILLGVQNAEHFAFNLDMVDQAWALGQRVSQLTYNSRNRIGNGATERVDGGISDWGAAVVQRMNQAGMAIDVSHCGDATTMDAFELSEQPVLITHSNSRALVPNHPRCKPDEAIQAMARSGGVMGITSVRNFVLDHEPTTLDSMLDHYDHVARLVGVEHLGLGSDIDLYGYDSIDPELYAQLKAYYKGSYAFRDKIDIEGVDHPQRCYDLTEGLIARGYSDDDIIGVLGGNFIRVLGETWGSRS